MADESEDLYGDIDDSPVFPMSTTADRGSASSAAAATTTSRNAPRSLVEEVQFLQDQVSKLERENQVLKRNMGILFRTTTAEIQRKDKEILRLQQQ